MRHRRFFPIAGVAVGLSVLLGSCERAALEPASEEELHLQLTVSDSLIQDGDSVSLEARIVSKSGAPVDPSAFSFEWIVDNGELAELEGQGNHVTLLALAPGEADLDVQAQPRSSAYGTDPLSAQRRFLFRPRPQKIEVLSGADQVGLPGAVLPEPVVVRLLDRGGRVLPGRQIAFRADSGGTVNPGTATTDANGTATASWLLPPRTGETSVVVRSTGVPDVTVMATAAVTDSSPRVARVVVTPDVIRWNAIGERLTLSATAYDSNNQSVSDERFRWRTSDANIATVDTMGRVTAHGIGSALIIASAVCCARADTTGVEVSQRVESITLSPDQLALQVGGSATLSVSAQDANQNPVASPAMSWSSSNTSIASVSAGRVTGVAAGSAFIRASSGDGRDSVQVTVASGSPPPATGLDNECASPGQGWIWCDDFAQNRTSSYFEYDNAGGRFVLENGAGVNGTPGMRATFAAGQSNAGSLKLAFGRTPDAYFDAVDAGTQNYREIYWRVFVRNAPDWTGGGGDKLSRAVVFANSNWAEAAIGHVWSGGTGHNYLMIDPASGTDTSGNLRTTQYNDFGNLRWLGSRRSNTAIFSGAEIGQWQCVETRMRLNDAGQSNGVFQLWIDGALEADRTGLNWLGSYSAYGINALFLENYWNDGSPQQQSRYFDNLVVSTQPIGCGSGAPSQPPPPPPGTPAPVASVTVSPASATLVVGSTHTLTATLRDSGGNTLADRSVAWSSNNTAIATVSASGVVTARAAGNATITATSEGRIGSSAIEVRSASSTAAQVVEDFSTYTSTADFLADPRGIYVDSEDFRPGQMTIDAAAGYGTSPQSLRYDYPAGTATDYTISRSLDLPGSNPSEVWVEVVVRFSQGFSVYGNGQGYGTSLKFMHIGVQGVSGRWGLEMDGNRLSMIAPSDAFEQMFASAGQINDTLMDGNWHVIRYHVRLGSTDFHETWVDGVHRGSASGSTAATGMTWVSLAKNLNMLAPNAQSLWWGRVSIWTQNPGW